MLRKKTLIEKFREDTGLLDNRGKCLAPVNLSKAKRSFLVVDTETVGDITIKEPAFPYDVSYLSIKNKKIIEKVSYINHNIYDDKYQMARAYYKNKIPFYEFKLKTDNNYQKVNDRDLLLALNKFIKDNDIKYFLAFNSPFDYDAINNLYQVVGVKNEFKKLFVIDIWKVCCDMLKTFPELYKSYMLFCYKNNLYTESGKNVSSNAEAFNRFVNNDASFIESHTGLEDTLAEYNIFLKMLWYYEKHKKQDYYYKLNTIFSHKGFTWKGGIFNIENIKTILKQCRNN